jgi:hypothetical protein
MFQSALEHPAWQEWRSTIAPKCYRYREGDQWTASERKTLKKRRQPETVNNHVSVTIKPSRRAICPAKMPYPLSGQKCRAGSARRRRSLRHQPFIRQINGLEFEERDQVDKSFTGGLGVLECGVTWDDISVNRRWCRG